MVKEGKKGRERHDSEHSTGADGGGFRDWDGGAGAAAVRHELHPGGGHHRLAPDGLPLLMVPGVGRREAVGVAGLPPGSDPGAALQDRDPGGHPAAAG